MRPCLILLAWIGLGQMARADPAGPDLDGDGIPDAGDRDTDGDGVADIDDNCDRHPNAEQADKDTDRVGDACDGDAFPAPPRRRVVEGAPARPVVPPPEARTRPDAEATLGAGARNGPVDDDTGGNAWFTSARLSLGLGLLHRLGVGPSGPEVGGHVVVAGTFDESDGVLEVGADALVRRPVGANAVDMRAALLLGVDDDQVRAPTWIARLGPGMRLKESVLVDLQLEVLGLRAGGVGFGAFGSIGVRGKGALFATGLAALAGVALYAVLAGGGGNDQ